MVGEQTQFVERLLRNYAGSASIVIGEFSGDMRRDHEELRRGVDHLVQEWEALTGDRILYEYTHPTLEYEEDDY